MAITLDTTRGGAASSSYISVIEADAALDLDAFAKAWRKASDDDKARLLATASRMLGDLPLRYAKSSPDQALDFPCADSTDDGGFTVAQSAAIAQAAHLAEYSADIQDAQSAAITGATSLPGPFGSTSVAKPRPYAKFSPEALRLLRNYLNFTGQIRRG